MIPRMLNSFDWLGRISPSNFWVDQEAFTITGWLEARRATTIHNPDKCWRISHLLLAR